MPGTQERAKLGQLICRKGRQGGLIGVGIMLFGFAFLIGAGAFLEGTVVMGVAGVVMFLFLVTMGVLMIRVGSRVHYLHENGIAIGDTALTFDEIEFYCRDNAHIGTAGIHTQTNITLVFVPFGRTMKPEVRFVWQAGRKGDDEIDIFHDRIVAAIVERMRVQLQTNGQERWTNGIAFHQEGLEFTSRIGAKSIVAYHELAEPEIKVRGPVGTEILFRRLGASEVLAKVRVDGKNVFPGLALLKSISERAGTGDSS